MKKIVFALQVFGIIALLPVYVALEMNHGNNSVYSSENKVVVTEKTQNASLDIYSSITTYPVAVLSLKSAVVKTKKKSAGTCCSCKNCKCGSSCMCGDL